MSDYTEVICERLGAGQLRPITKVIYECEPEMIRVEVAGHTALRLSVVDARKLGDALTVASGTGFLRKQREARKKGTS